MTETKFTPGPWSIERYGDGSSLVIHSDEDNRVCFMATASSDRPTSHAAIRANARLIAAAPALYEALSGIIEMAEDLAAIFPIKLNDEGLSAVDRARSALLLANTGGTENG